MVEVVEVVPVEAPEEVDAGGEDFLVEIRQTEEEEEVQQVDAEEDLRCRIPVVLQIDNVMIDEIHPFRTGSNVAGWTILVVAESFDQRSGTGIATIISTSVVPEVGMTIESGIGIETIQSTVIVPDPGMTEAATDITWNKKITETVPEAATTMIGIGMSIVTEEETMEGDTMMTTTVENVARVTTTNATRRKSDHRMIVGIVMRERAPVKDTIALTTTTEDEENVTIPSPGKGKAVLKIMTVRVTMMGRGADTRSGKRIENVLDLKTVTTEKRTAANITNGVRSTVSGMLETMRGATKSVIEGASVEAEAKRNECKITKCFFSLVVSCIVEVAIKIV